VCTVFATRIHLARIHLEVGMERMMDGGSGYGSDPMSSGADMAGAGDERPARRPARKKSGAGSRKRGGKKTSKSRGGRSRAKSRAGKARGRTRSRAKKSSRKARRR
jgi:hypothetical protein